MNWNEFQSVATRPQELMSPAGTGRKGGLRRGNNADCRTLQIHHLGGGEIRNCADELSNSSTPRQQQHQIKEEKDIRRNWTEIGNDPRLVRHVGEPHAGVTIVNPVSRKKPEWRITIVTTIETNKSLLDEYMRPAPRP